MKRFIVGLATAMMVPLGPGQVTKAALFVGLGDLPGGIFESGALDVSADGSVVVGSSR